MEMGMDARGGRVECEVVEMSWSSDSMVMAVQLVEVGGERGSAPGKLQLYYRGNYHWYLKREFLFVDGLVAAAFDSEKSSLLRMLSAQATLHELELSWGCVVDGSQQSACCVIDGGKVLVTPLRKTVIPPPISMFKLSSPSAPVQEVFCDCSKSADAISERIDCHAGALL
mmetsp:Transcript_11723/g.29648  ORF Transcript_11723/g.29648 Transcript_11723/m.29648 type:complete len:170 (-) Transcript_11723:737-1246(-)